MDFNNLKFNKFEDYPSYYFEKKNGFYLKSDISIPDHLIIDIIKKREEEILAIKKQLKRLCLKVFELNPIYIYYLENKGTFHNIFKVFLSNENNYIIKTSINSFPYRNYDFFITKWIMKTLKLNKLPFLHIYDLDISRSKFAFDYIIMDEARGIPLISFTNDEKDYINYLFKLGEIIAKIHLIPSKGYGYLDVEQLITSNTAKGLITKWKYYIFQELEEHIQFCFIKGYINVEQKKTIQKVFKEIQSIFFNEKPNILHGDLGNQNIFFYNNHISAILDWEDCLSGDKLFDIALWGTFVGNHEKLPFFIEGYESINSLPNDFYIKYWIYYLRIILAKTVHRFRFQYYKRDRIPANERILYPLNKIIKLI